MHPCPYVVCSILIFEPCCGTPVRSPRLNLSLTHTLSLMHTHTLTHTHALTLTLALSHSHSHSLTLTLYQEEEGKRAGALRSLIEQERQRILQEAAGKLGLQYMPRGVLTSKEDLELFKSYAPK